MYFNNIIGQEFAKKYITNSIKNDKVNHAYMFEGIDGIGKNLFAKEFGKLLINVDNVDNSPDYINIEPTGSSIKIAQIRELQSDIIIKPHSKYKIYVINHAEKMTVESQNALLKTLEEAGVKPIEAVGQPFDPNFHNAVMHVDDETLGENVIAEEFQKGYLYRDSVVRHSMVKVAN